MKNILRKIGLIQRTFKLKAETKGQHTHKYAKWGALLNALMPYFEEHKLVVTTDEIADPTGQIKIILALYDEESEETRESSMWLIDGDPQGVRGSSTYYKRTMLENMLGICAHDDDDDGKSASDAYHKKGPLRGAATEKQIEFIKRNINYDTGREAKLCTHFGVDSLQSLTKDQASQAIEMFKKD